MKLPIMRTALAATALGMIAAVSIRTNGANGRHHAKRELQGEEPTAESGVDVEQASRAFLNYVLLPVWMLPGLGDYLCHRAAKIERTSGTHESLTHMLMISTSGVGIMAGLLFEVNETVLVVMAAAAAAHEAIVLWDVGYAAHLRPPSPTEQHMHSFLEVLPFTGLAFTMCLNPGDVAVLFGKGTRPPRFRLKLKQHPAAPAFTAAVIALATVTLFLPYTEELIRCYRVDHTFRAHDRPIDESPAV